MANPADVIARLDAMDARQLELSGFYQQTLEQQREQDRLRSIKYVRLPLLIGTMATGLTLGGDQQPGQTAQTPEQGYIWHLRHLVIEGLTASATAPDTINILRQGRIVWQLNGNQFAQTWSRGEMRLIGGELLAYAAVGTITSKTITIHGTAEEVAAPEEGKFK